MILILPICSQTMSPDKKLLVVNIKISPEVDIFIVNSFYIDMTRKLSFAKPQMIKFEKLYRITSPPSLYAAFQK